MELFDINIREVPRRFKGLCPDCDFTFIVEETTDKEVIEVTVPGHQEVTKSGNTTQTVSENICKGGGKTTTSNELISSQKRDKRELEFARQEDELRKKIWDVLNLEVICQAKSFLTVRKEGDSFDLQITTKDGGWERLESSFSRLGWDLFETFQNLVDQQIGPGFKVGNWKIGGKFSPPEFRLAIFRKKGGKS